MSSLPLAIGNRLELFVDHFLIERLTGTRLLLHSPTPANVALSFDQPWEGPFCGYATVIRDTDRYRLYYRGWPGVASDETAVYCYAESRDGIAFERPRLSLHAVDNSRDNNVFLVHPEAVHSFSPFLDGRPGVPAAARFKALGVVTRDRRHVLLAYGSADGIRWSRLQDEPVLTQGAFDSQNVAFWSTREGCYVAYYRTWDAAADPTQFAGRRTVSRATSADFLHWTDPVPMDYGDTPREELYTNQTHPYYRAPHLYIALPKRFVPGRQTLGDAEAAARGVVPPYHRDVSDTVFMTTRGGTRYDRTFLEAFIRPGPDRANWVSRTNMSALNVVPTGPGEMSLYVQQRYATTSHYLRRYTLRTDGFVSVNAPYAGGELLTKPLVCGGRQLVLNYATSAPGTIRVELQNPDGRPLPGFTLADSVAVFGDEIDRVVTWAGAPDLSALAGRPVRLRLVMNDADLYSVQFREQPPPP